MNVCVAVVTYRRPKLLGTLLDSLLASIEEARACVDLIDVLVVDNDPGESARAIVTDHSLSPRYVPEPRPGISAARNAALGALSDSAEAVIFVDDDEIVSPAWLRSITAAFRQFECQMVAGPVLSVLPNSVPNDLAASGVFERPRRESGAPLTEAGAGNLLISAALVRGLPSDQWFRDDLGITGGEDAEFTRRMARSGYSLVWCDEAVAWEPVSEARASWRWVAQRYRRIGYTDCVIDRVSRSSALAGGITRLLASLPVLIFWLVLSPTLKGELVRRAARGVGFARFALSSPVREYRRVSQ